MSRDPISEDPDVVQAVADFRGAVLEIRRRASEATKLPDHDPYRRHHADRIAEITSVIALRAEKLRMQADALILLVNADLDSRARRGRNAPTRPTSRTLLTALTNAQAREQQARAALLAAQTELTAAIGARTAAQQACATYGAGRKAAA